MLINIQMLIISSYHRFETCF